MDCPGEGTLHRRVVHRVVAKGHVAHHEVKKVIREVRGFKALGEDRGVRVECPGNPGGEPVQFNACPVSAVQCVWHEAEKMPDTQSRFKHVETACHAELA